MRRLRSAGHGNLPVYLEGKTVAFYLWMGVAGQ
jgi:hypothetical protein